ncbi:MAG: ABC transporter substrate-binding protein [Oscillospiraceae bacterium]|jgi:ABC-type nitrate/sulfonate/bicarbonate transport system substrate-binding protein|nr:ABC transporter substrate-binding protein [Oscillospiraceae bacterium]
MKKYKLVPSLACVVIIVLAVWLRWGDGGAELEPVTVVLDGLPGVSHTGIYVAQELGYYRDAGIKLDIIRFANKENVAALIATETGDFGISSREDVESARESALPVRAIAAVTQDGAPVIVASETMLANRPELVRAFLAATAKGYEYAAAEPDKAAAMLYKVAEGELDALKQAQRVISEKYIGGAEKWGVMSASAWAAGSMTNEFLP